MPVFLDQFELVLLFTWKSTNTSYWTTYNWNENRNKIRQRKTHNKISIFCEGYEYGRPLSTLVSHKPNSAKDSVQSLVVLNICKYNYGLTQWLCCHHALGSGVWGQHLTHISSNEQSSTVQMMQFSFPEKWINEILWFFVTFPRFNDFFHIFMTEKQILWLFKILWPLGDLYYCIIEF